MKDPTNTAKHLLKLLQDGPLGLATFDSAYRFLSVNQALGEMLVYSAQELSGLTLANIVHGDDLDELKSLTRQLSAGTMSTFTLEQRWLKKDGDSLWVVLTVSAVDDEPGTSVALVENITLYKQVEADCRRLRGRLAQTEQLVTLGRLASTLTHEINNSMHVVQGLLNLSLEELDDPVELTSYLNMSLGEAAKIGQLIGRLRYSYRALPENPELFQLNQILAEIGTLAQRELKYKKVNVHIHLAPDVPSLTSRSNQVYLIVLSLVLNMGEMLGNLGGGDIDIRSHTLPQGVDVTIAGRIAAEIQGKIPVWSEEIELDLGLSFSRDKIVELGGELTIEQQDGGMACVIKIPFSIPETPPTI